jgi:hypothetical protein
METTLADEEYETPSPTQAELNAMNRAVYGIAEEKPKTKKDDEADDELGAKDGEQKAVSAEKPAGYKTRAAKAD